MPATRPDRDGQQRDDRAACARHWRTRFRASTDKHDCRDPGSAMPRGTLVQQAVREHEPVAGDHAGLPLRTAAPRHSEPANIRSGGQGR